jgi:uncharacterized protein YndB with AHSA1/START domain
MNEITSEQKGNVMIVKRTFDAPMDLLFEVHSDCKHLMNWYGGDEWPLSKCEMDFRVGGKWNYCFKMPDEEACGLAIYKEIKRPDKIVYKDHFLDKQGDINKELPSSLITFEFIEENEKTTVVNRWEYTTEKDLNLMLEMGAIEGLTEIWDRLHRYLIKQRSKL